MNTLVYPTHRSKNKTEMYKWPPLPSLYPLPPIFHKEQEGGLFWCLKLWTDFVRGILLRSSWNSHRFLVPKENRDLSALIWGFPGSVSGKEPACQCKRHKRCGFEPWIRKIPWRRAWQPTPVFLLGELPGQRSLVGYSPWRHKGWTRLSDLHFITL